MANLLHDSKVARCLHFVAPKPVDDWDPSTLPSAPGLAGLGIQKNDGFHLVDVVNVECPPEKADLLHWVQRFAGSEHSETWYADFFPMPDSSDRDRHAELYRIRATANIAEVSGPLILTSMPGHSAPNIPM